MNKNAKQNEASTGIAFNQVASQAISILVNKRAMIRPITQVNNPTVVGGVEFVSNDDKKSLAHDGIKQMHNLACYDATRLISAE